MRRKQRNCIPSCNSLSRLCDAIVAHKEPASKTERNTGIGHHPTGVTTCFGMNVEMRLRRVAGVASASQALAGLHLLTNLHEDAPAFQVRKEYRRGSGFNRHTVARGVTLVALRR